MNKTYIAANINNQIATSLAGYAAYSLRSVFAIAASTASCKSKWK